jgi:hypothetical protein
MDWGGEMMYLPFFKCIAKTPQKVELKQTSRFPDFIDSKCPAEGSEFIRDRSSVF